jgi:predicted DNA-binding transcriptional regulator AlpA
MRRERRRRIRRRRALAIVLILLLPVLYSYVSMTMQPSSLPLGVRSVEWVRAHGGAWLVNDVERIYYSWTAPKPGGPGLKTLPVVSRPVKVVRASAFRPARVPAALSPRLAGEGVWHAVTPLVHGTPPVLVTTFRPDPAYPRVVAYVAWIDHKRTQLALYPGRYEPPGHAQRGPLSVPWGQRWRLLATFNSGFAYRDAHGGFAVDGRVFTPLVRNLGTIVAYADGRVDVVAWHGGSAPGRRVVLARQNLPLIVNGGRPNPNLSDGPAWGATLGNAIRVWRTGVGVDRHGNLIFAAADYQTVASLAAILVRAGAVRAVELDINPQWPSFITYARGGGRNAAKLVPNNQQPATRYLVPDDRDFFAVYRRLPTGIGSVPFR